MGRREKGTGSVWYDEARKVWRCEYQGKRRTAKSKREAQARLAELRGELARQAQGQPDYTVAGWLTHWLETSVRGRGSPGTYDTYERAARRLLVPLVGSNRLSALTPLLVQQAQAQMLAIYAPATVSVALACLSASLAEAVRLELLDRNPVRLVRGVRVTAPVIVPMTRAQAAAILAAVKGERLRAMVTVGLALGLRVGEVLGLAWRDVDLAGGRLAVVQQAQAVSTRQRRADQGTRELRRPKTEGSIRGLRLPAVLVTALKERQVEQKAERLKAEAGWQDSGLVFTSLKGGQLDRTTVSLFLRRALALAGLPPLRFHDLRHGAATLMLAQGVPLRVVMEVLGHTSASMAMVYIHVQPEQLEDVAARMDLALGG